MSYLIVRLAVAYDSDADPAAAAAAREDMARIPDDITGARLCALCGALSGWVA